MDPLDPYGNLYTLRWYGGDRFLRLDHITSLWPDDPFLASIYEGCFGVEDSPRAGAVQSVSALLVTSTTYLTNPAASPRQPTLTPTVLRTVSPNTEQRLSAAGTTVLQSSAVVSSAQVPGTQYGSTGPIGGGAAASAQPSCTDVACLIGSAISVAISEEASAVKATGSSSARPPIASSSHAIAEISSQGHASPANVSSAVPSPVYESAATTSQESRSPASPDAVAAKSSQSSAVVPLTIGSSAATPNSPSRLISAGQILTLGSTTIILGSGAATSAVLAWDGSRTAVEVNGVTLFLLASNDLQLSSAAVVSVLTAESALHVVLDSQMLTAGKPSIVFEGIMYSLASSGTALTIDRKTARLAISAAQQTGVPSTTVARATVIPNSASLFVVGSRVLSPGGSAVVATGPTYSLSAGEGSIVMDGQAVDIFGSQHHGMATTSDTVAGLTGTATSGGGYFVGFPTLLPGGQAMSVSGTTHSLPVGETAIVVKGQTTPTSSLTGQGAAAPSITVAGSTVFANSAGQYILGSQILIPGGQAITVSGTIYSLAPPGTAIVVDGNTSPIQSLQVNTDLEGVATVEDGQLLTFVRAGSGVVVEDESTSFTLPTGARSVLQQVTVSIPTATGAVALDWSTVHVAGGKTSSGISESTNNSVTDITKSSCSRAIPQSSSRSLSVEVWGLGSMRSAGLRLVVAECLAYTVAAVTFWSTL